MHVVAKSAIVEFWRLHPDAKLPLEAWHQIMVASGFTDFNALRSTFASADYVKGLTFFNIGGNKYRLIASIHYNRQKLYLRAVLTHAAYDRGDWKKE
jgi:mRNA interferase HigB